MTGHARFSVADEMFETLVRESFNRQGLMKHLGAELVEVEPGQATIRVRVAENPALGAPRIHGELLKLGFDISERSVSRWIHRAPTDPDPVGATRS